MQTHINDLQQQVQDFKDRLHTLLAMVIGPPYLNVIGRDLTVSCTQVTSVAPTIVPATVIMTSSASTTSLVTLTSSGITSYSQPSAVPPTMSATTSTLTHRSKDNVASIKYLSYFVIDLEHFHAKDTEQDAGFWLVEIKVEFINKDHLDVTVKFNQGSVQC